MQKSQNIRYSIDRRNTCGRGKSDQSYALIWRIEGSLFSWGTWKWNRQVHSRNGPLDIHSIYIQLNIGGVNSWRLNQHQYTGRGNLELVGHGQVVRNRLVIRVYRLQNRELSWNYQANSFSRAYRESADNYRRWKQTTIARHTLDRIRRYCGSVLRRRAGRSGWKTRKYRTTV